MRLPKSLLVTTCSAALVTGMTELSLKADEPATAPTTQMAKASTEKVPDLDGQAASDEPTSESSAFVAPEGFRNLVPADGLDGWIVQEGKPSAWIREGETISCISSTGGWLRTEHAYSDFILRLEYRLQPGGNTGIGIRTPESGNPTFTGLEVQLLDDSSPKYADLRPDQYTGSVYYQVAASARAILNPPGEWNTCEVECSGDRMRVRINGQLVNDVDLVAKEEDKQRTTDSTGESSYSLAQRPPLGHIALQSHSTRVDFRHIVLKDLTVTTDSGLHYVDLADGIGDSVPDDAMVTVHYVGQLIDGKRFTDTRDVGEPVTVALSKVIPGWKEGIEGMKIGGRRRLIVPPHLGYGEEGVNDLIPPDATLVFEVELCGFESAETTP